MDPEVAAAPKRNWRFFQWIIIAAWAVSMTVLSIVAIAGNQLEAKSHTPPGCAMGFLTALAHGAWITLDCRLLNRKVGGWRFAAFFLGPLAIWAYLLTNYGRKAAYMIPASLAVYAIPFGQLILVEALMEVFGIKLSPT